MTEYPSQLNKIEAHARRRLRARWLAQQKKRRHIAENLIRKGVKRRQAYRHIYSNRGSWALSHSLPVDRGLPNKWFKQQGLWTRTDQKLIQWKPLNVWVRLT